MENQQKQKNILKLFVVIAVIALICFIFKFTTYHTRVSNVFNEKQENNSSFPSIFYYTELSTVGKNPNTSKVSIYKISDDPSVPDEKIMDIDDKFVQGISNATPQNIPHKIFLFTYDPDNRFNQLYSLDLMTKNISFIKQSAPGRSIMGTMYLHDQSKLALITTSFEYERAINTELEIIDLRTGNVDQVFKLSEKGVLYGGTRPVASSPDDSLIYLTERGGDGGMMWGSDYILERKTGSLINLGNNGIGCEDLNCIKENAPFTLFNPSGTRNAFVTNSTTYGPEQISTGTSWNEGCLKDYKQYQGDGAVLMIEDINTRTKKEVYRNLTHSNNYCHNLVRRIDSFRWLDDDNIIFSTPVGIYEVNVNTNVLTEKFTFDRFNDPKTVQRPTIVSVSGDFVVLSDQTILNLETKKTISISKPRVPENINREGYFVTTEIIR